MQQIDTLMGQAQGINFRVDGLDQQFRALFPNDSTRRCGATRW
ncbi:hypothetical protein [Hankyongella ginsenosidimutans]